MTGNTIKRVPKVCYLDAHTMPELMFDRQKIERRIKAELRAPALCVSAGLENDTGQYNFYAQVQAVASLIKEYSGDNNDIRLRQGAAAQYGGIVKKWRRFLIETITAEVWSGCETSRDVIRDWQQKVFGQSIKASRLKAYGHPERSGEGRPRRVRAAAEGQAGQQGRGCDQGGVGLGSMEIMERDASGIYEEYREEIGRAHV